MFVKALQRRGVTHCVIKSCTSAHEGLRRERWETEQIGSDGKDTDSEDRFLSWRGQSRCGSITEGPIFASHQEHISYQCVWSPQTGMHSWVLQMSSYHCLKVYCSFSHLLLLQKDSKVQSRVVVSQRVMAIRSPTPFSGSLATMILHPFLYVVRCHLMNFNSWWLTCSYSFHFWDVGSQTALNRVFYFENLTSEAVQIAHISEDWLIRAAQKVISWGEMQYPGSPCTRQTEKKSVQRECHRNPK